MKRLFQVNDPHGKAVKDEKHEVYYFANKGEAKNLRNGNNAMHKGGGYTVGRGPDHDGYVPRKGRGHVRANRTHQARS